MKITIVKYLMKHFQMILNKIKYFKIKIYNIKLKKMN